MTASLRERAMLAFARRDAQRVEHADQQHRLLASEASAAALERLGVTSGLDDWIAGPQYGVEVRLTVDDPIDGNLELAYRLEAISGIDERAGQLHLVDDDALHPILDLADLGQILTVLGAASPAPLIAPDPEPW